MTGFSKLRLSFQIILIVIVVGVFGSLAFSRDLNRLPCKKLPEGVTRKQIEEDFEKYRKGEITILESGPFNCQEALPVLKKYALDSDPRLREIVTLALGTAYYDLYKSFYPEVFELLLLQIEKFPLYKSAFPQSYAANYPCYRYKKIKNKQQLTNALISRIKYRNREFSRDEIYLLGCLSRHEQKAKQFLLEIKQPDYQSQLDETDRQNQKELISYALAEAGLKDAEDKVLADIEVMTASSDANQVQSILDDAKSFTNCRIVRRYISLIEDKREISKSEYQNGEIRQLKGRVGDMAVSQFTSLYGSEVTGEKDVSFRAHTDAEMERIYKRVKSFVKRKVTDSCGLEE